MSAIGAAVNEMREAQSLMRPIMLLLIAPVCPDADHRREPNSTFSVAVSFIPPVNTFAMMMRLASDRAAAVLAGVVDHLVGLGAAAAAVWFAAKIFRIGLLMHGKPPDFATMIRWAREA